MGLEELFDQAREQLQDLKTRMERAKKRRDAKAQEEEQLAEARRRSREEVPGQSSFGAFSSSSRGPLEREREPKAGSRKKEEKKRSEEKRKEEVKKEEVPRALSEAPWRRGSRHRESPKPAVPAPKTPPKTPPKTKAKPVEPRTPPPKAGTPARTPRVQPPPTTKKEKEEESQEEENRRLLATAAAKWKAGAGKPTMLPRPKLLRSPVSWAGMRFRDRVAHHDAIRGKSPRGTVGEALLVKQGEACSTCKDRRTRFRKDAGRLLKKRMKEYRAAAAKAAGSHYARKVFERENLVRADRPNKDELRIPRVKKTEGKEEEKKEEEESDKEQVSVEPEDNEEETDFDEDPPDEGEEKEAKEKKEEKKEPRRAKSEEREETPREAREAIAITGSTSTAMQRMLAQGLAETNRVNLTVVGKKLEIRRNRLKTEMLTDKEAEDLEKEIEAFEAEQEKLLEERERLQAQRTTVVREEPKDRRDQGVHDSRYRRAVAGGTSHWKAWKEEKGRRRAQEHRRSGVGERARERIKADKRWHARHDRKLKDSDFVDNQQEDADIDTELIDAEGLSPG